MPLHVVTMSSSATCRRDLIRSFAQMYRSRLMRNFLAFPLLVSAKKKPVQYLPFSFLRIISVYYRLSRSRRHSRINGPPQSEVDFSPGAIRLIMWHSISHPKKLAIAGFPHRRYPSTNVLRYQLLPMIRSLHQLQRLFNRTIETV